MVHAFVSKWSPQKRWKLGAAHHEQRDLSASQIFDFTPQLLR